jgi:hypothetical protein
VHHITVPVVVVVGVIFLHAQRIDLESGFEELQPFARPAYCSVIGCT